MPHIFISYRTGDETYAAILVDEKMCDRFGAANVFRDNRSIPLGQDFRPALWGSLAKSHVLIVIIGPRWRARIFDPHDFVREEVAFALKIGISVIPVLVNDAAKPTRAELPDELADLASRQYIRIGLRDAQHGIARLVEEVAGQVSGPDATGSAARPPTAPPTPPPPTPPPRRGTVVGLRIVEPGAVATREARRQALFAAVDEAVVEARLTNVEVTARRAGATLFVPAAVPAARVAGGFVKALDAALVDHQPDDGGFLMLKVGVHDGVVDGDGMAGDAVDEAEALLGLPVLDDVLRNVRRARLVLAVTHDFFDQVVRPSPRLFDAATFRAADTGGDSPPWIHVPNYPSPPRVAGFRSPDRAAGPNGGTSAPTVYGNHLDLRGTTVGDVYAGDRVEGSKIVFGGER